MLLFGLLHQVLLIRFSLDPSWREFFVDRDRNGLRKGTYVRDNPSIRHQFACVALLSLIRLALDHPSSALPHAA